jgi:hypothetical protein
MSNDCNLNNVDREYVARFTQLFKNGNYIEAAKVAAMAPQVRLFVFFYLKILNTSGGTRW